MDFWGLEISILDDNLLRCVKLPGCLLSICFLVFD